MTFLHAAALAVITLDLAGVFLDHHLLPHFLPQLVCAGRMTFLREPCASLHHFFLTRARSYNTTLQTVLGYTSVTFRLAS